MRTNFSTRTVSTAPPPYSPQRPPRYTFTQQTQRIAELPTQPTRQTYLTPIIFFRALAVILALASLAVGAANSSAADDDDSNTGDADYNPAVFGVVRSLLSLDTLQPLIILAARSGSRILGY